MPNYKKPIEHKRSYRGSEISIYMNERYYLMPGETLEDYFRLLNLDDTKKISRKYKRRKTSR
jgi:hypothetical protein